MNLLLINYEYPPVGGGAATATREIARALADLGHRPFVLTARFRGRDPAASREEGVTVLEVPAIRRHRDRCSVWEMATFAAGAVLRVRRIVRTHRIDGIIAFFSLPCGPVAWWAYRASGVPYVVSLRGGDVPGNEPELQRMHRWLRPIRRRVLGDARAIVANSEGLKTLAEAADGFPVAVIPNGVDATFFSPPAQRPSTPPLRLLFVGRFQPQKNLRWLLEQLAAVRTPNLDFELTLVGGGPELPLLQSLAVSRGLAGRTKWAGWLDRPALRSAYRESHCLINPSHYEGLPNVVLEAMACGLPVLASDVPGNRDLLVEGRGGLLFRPGDAAYFYAQLLACLAERDALGRAGTAAVRTRSWSGIAARYAELFQSRGLAP